MLQIVIVILPSSCKSIELCSPIDFGFCNCICIELMFFACSFFQVQKGCRNAEISGKRFLVLQYVLNDAGFEIKQVCGVSTLQNNAKCSRYIRFVFCSIESNSFLVNPLIMLLIRHLFFPDIIGKDIAYVVSDEVVFYVLFTSNRIFGFCLLSSKEFALDFFPLPLVLVDSVNTDKTGHCFCYSCKNIASYAV